MNKQKHEFYNEMKTKCKLLTFRFLLIKIQNIINLTTSNQS